MFHFRPGLPAMHDGNGPICSAKIDGSQISIWNLLVSSRDKRALLSPYRHQRQRMFNSSQDIYVNPLLTLQLAKGRVRTRIFYFTFQRFRNWTPKPGTSAPLESFYGSIKPIGCFIQQKHPSLMPRLIALLLPLCEVEVSHTLGVQ